MISKRTSSIPKGAAAGERQKHRQALCTRLQHNCEVCNTRLLLMCVYIIKKYRRYVYNVTCRLSDG